jgi:hypothetical protein
MIEYEEVPAVGESLVAGLCVLAMLIVILTNGMRRKFISGIKFVSGWKIRKLKH